MEQLLVEALFLSRVVASLGVLPPFTTARFCQVSVIICMDKNHCYYCWVKRDSERITCLKLKLEHDVMNFNPLTCRSD